MKSMRLAAILCSMFCALIIGACNGDAEVEVENGTDTTVVVPDTNQTNTNTGTASDTTGGVGQTVTDESVEKLVEAALVAKPGFEGVDVESKPDGIIILTGTVPTENEKAQAKVIAENIAGVKGVENNVTVAPANP